jgi:hypothetical protein
MKKLPNKLTKFPFFSEITGVPAELWDDIASQLRRNMQKSDRAQPGVVSAKRWNVVIESKELMAGSLPPQDDGDAADMITMCTHIARAERMFESAFKGNSFALPKMTDDLHDVELAFIANVGLHHTNDREVTRRALNRFGQSGETDMFVPYEGLLHIASGLADTPDRENEFFECIDRLVQLGTEQDYDVVEMALRSKADHFISTDRQAQGIEIYEALQRQNPMSTTNFASLGFALMEIDNIEDAVPYLMRGLKMSVAGGDFEETEYIGETLVELDAISEDDLQHALAAIEDLPFDEDDDFDDEDLVDDQMESIVEEHPEYAEILASKKRGGAFMEANIHMAMHRLVEQQLEDEEFDNVRYALMRLTCQGLSRNEAIHEIMGVVSGASLNLSVTEDPGEIKKKFDRDIDALGR